MLAVDAFSSDATPTIALGGDATLTGEAGVIGSDRAALNLLTRAAGSRPVLCIIDDAHWLDQPSAQALAFVARRLDSKPVVLLFATIERYLVGGLTAGSIR